MNILKKVFGNKIAVALYILALLNFLSRGTVNNFIKAKLMKTKSAILGDAAQSSGEKNSASHANKVSTNWIFVPDLKEVISRYGFFALRQSPNVEYNIKEALCLQTDLGTMTRRFCATDDEGKPLTDEKLLLTQSVADYYVAFQKKWENQSDKDIKKHLHMFYDGPMRNWVYVPNLKANLKRYGCIILQDPLVFEYDINIAINKGTLSPIIPADTKKPEKEVKIIDAAEQSKQPEKGIFKKSSKKVQNEETPQSVPTEKRQVQFADSEIERPVVSVKNIEKIDVLSDPKQKNPTDDSKKRSVIQTKTNVEKEKPDKQMENVTAIAEAQLTSLDSEGWEIVHTN